ncbi:MAG TPA: SPW repeat protein [Stellaceae bacterium]|nr:SPW repeat protein [Stellaceae bacterium]
MAQQSPLDARDARRWQDWINLILGVWLFISPWVLGFAAGYAPAAPSGGTSGGAAAPAAAGVSGASWNAWIFGVIVAVIALSAFARLAPWQAWLTLAIGIWLFIAPWVLGFSALASPAWDHWIVGALVFLVSLGTLSQARRTTVDYARAGRKPTDPPSR